MTDDEQSAMTARPAAYRFLARATPVAHATFVAILVGGAAVVARKPRFARLHLPLLAAMAAVAGTHSDCPLTVLEQHARDRSGLPRHDTGFVDHYMVRPLYPKGITRPVQAALIAAWILPNVIGYAKAIRRRV